jgi:hypothetical protein
LILIYDHSQRRFKHTLGIAAKILFEARKKIGAESPAEGNAKRQTPFDPAQNDKTVTARIPR